jgi:uridylate kinase
MIAWKGADSMNYGRVMLKLSGEALAGSGGKGYDEAVVRNVAQQVKVSVDAGVQVGIVTGGGNYWRGRTSEAIARTKADQIGMLATIMNCIYVSEIFRAEGMKTAILSPFICGTMTELFSVDLANRYFNEGTVVFFAGGTGHPYFSTDTGIALRAVEVGADAILLAKSIDGVYTADPKIDPSAKRYDTITMQEMIDKKLAVIDLTASVLCMENHVPLAIFDLNEENSIANAMQGKINGTIVTVE